MVGDGIVFAACDVQFDILWRPAGSNADAGADVTVVSFSHHFEKNPPLPDGRPNFDAVPFEATGVGARVETQPGDLLVWRFSVAGNDGAIRYAPNGDGAHSNGLIPFIELP